MDNRKLQEAVEKYHCRGMIRSTDFLLPPPDAVAFAGDLANLDILILGCDLSRYADAGRTQAMELATAGNVVNARLSSDDVRGNAKVIQDFLSSELPHDADLVSFVYADPDTWDLILEYARCPESAGHARTITLKYQTLIRDFVDGGLPVDEFERRYLADFKAEPGGMDPALFTILDRLFGAVDAYWSEVEPGQESPFLISEHRLREEARTALDQLHAYLNRHPTDS